MTRFDAAWAAKETARRKWMEEHSLYREDDEHASCGVGLVVSIDGKPSRRVVENGIDALKAVWHRGAVDADGKTGGGKDSGKAGCLDSHAAHNGNEAYDEDDIPRQVLEKLGQRDIDLGFLQSTHREPFRPAGCHEYHDE